jgi:SAM-dependent methyltransferase
VLDLGCGHGEFALTLAPRCWTMTGIEREAGYLELAKELAAERGATNITFLQANLAGPDDEDRDFVGIPLPDDSIDLFINRRGPLLRRYLAEALRVGRPGAVIVGLHPTGNVPAPPWRHQLPAPYQDVFMALPFEEVTGWVTKPLNAAGIADYSLWWIDVPEVLRNPHELYTRLRGLNSRDALSYPEAEPYLVRIFEQHGSAAGVTLRHQRLLWQAYFPT